MVATTTRNKRQDAAIERIEAHARSLAGESPELAEAAQRIKNVKAQDQDHERLFRLEAVADLLALVDEITAGEANGNDSGDLLEDKNVSELKDIAKDEGVEAPYKLNKAELIEAIRKQRIN